LAIHDASGHPALHLVTNASLESCLFILTPYPDLNLNNETTDLSGVVEVIVLWIGDLLCDRIQSTK